MGIKKLWQLLDLFAEPTSLQEWRGKRVAIDASVWVSQFRSVAFANKLTTTSVAGSGMSDEELIKVLEGFLMRIIKLWSYDIIPVFVFDGPAPMIKQREQERRAALRSKLEEGKLARIAMHVLRAQVGAGNEANLKKAAAWADEHHHKSKHHGSSSSRKRAHKKASANDNDNLESESNVDEDSTSSDDRMDEAQVAVIVARARRIRQRAKAAALAADAIAQAAPVPIARVNMATNAFLHMEGVRQAVRMDRDEAHRGNALLNHSASAVSSAFLGSRAAIEATTTGTRRKSGQTHVPEVSYPEADLSRIPQRSDEYKGLMLKSTGGQKANHNVQRPTKSPSVTVIDSCSATPVKKGRMTEVIEVSNTSSFHIDEADSDEDTSNGFSATAAAAFEVSKPQIHPYDPSLRLASELADLEQMLLMLGVAYVISPSESDQQCAYLCSRETGVVDAVLTEDSDIVARGAACVLRGFFSTNVENVKAYRQSVLAHHGLTIDVMKGLAMLLGCDYCEGIKGLGIKGALRVIATLWPVDSRAKTSASTNWTMLEDFQLLQAKQLQGPVVHSLMLSEERHSLLQHQMAAKWFSTRPMKTPDHFPDEEALKAFYNAPVRYFAKDKIKGEAADAIFNNPEHQSSIAHFLLLRGLSDFAVRKVQLLFQQKQESTSTRRQQKETTLNDFFQRTSRVKVSPLPSKLSVELELLRGSVLGTDKATEGHPVQ